MNLSSSICSVNVSLSKIASPDDVTDQTRPQARANSAVTQSGAYFQTFENSQKIVEITYNYFFFQPRDQE